MMSIFTCQRRTQPNSLEIQLSTQRDHLLSIEALQFGALKIYLTVLMRSQTLGTRPLSWTWLRLKKMYLQTTRLCGCTRAWKQITHCLGKSSLTRDTNSCSISCQCSERFCQTIITLTVQCPWLLFTRKRRSVKPITYIVSLGWPRLRKMRKTKTRRTIHIWSRSWTCTSYATPQSTSLEPVWCLWWLTYLNIPAFMS